MLEDHGTRARGMVRSRGAELALYVGPRTAMMAETSLERQSSHRRRSRRWLSSGYDPEVCLGVIQATRWSRVRWS